MIQNTRKLQALSLAKECYSMKMDLLTNATVVDDAIRFVSQQSSDNKKLVSKAEENSDIRESKEPDYDEDEDQLEEDQKEQIGEASEATINEVF